MGSPSRRKAKRGHSAADDYVPHSAARERKWRHARSSYVAAWNRLKLARVGFLLTIITFAGLAVICVVGVITPIEGLPVRATWVAALLTGLVAAVAHSLWITSPCPRCGQAFAGPEPTPPDRCQHCGLPYRATRDPDRGGGATAR
jgi:hypothetical protein